jgi:hypothetical protein
VLIGIGAITAQAIKTTDARFVRTPQYIAKLCKSGYERRELSQTQHNRRASHGASLTDGEGDDGHEDLLGPPEIGGLRVAQLDPASGLHLAMGHEVIQTPISILIFRPVILHAKYTERRLYDFTARG